MSDKPVLVLATTNQGKVAELVELLAEYFEVVPRPADVPETDEDQPTLVGNARKKATEIAVATGLAALADDTGLFVDALDGGPGVRTARYAGLGATFDQNIAKLLLALDGIEADGRPGWGAQFRTCIALVWPDGRELLGEGSVEGRIAAERRGSSGFGYDPVFAPLEGDGRTFGEMTRDEKARYNHRVRAFDDLL
ncbi:MAG: non-canonical purine NTP pyrophosphatase, partial [Actinomycetota bacterium]|nr:non-canonical purine NTP pyrophosphatase [Actinomycetota bacterium]